jgi:hypothetical protein
MCPSCFRPAGHLRAGTSLVRRLFLAELEHQMTAGKVQERLVYDTDAGGVAIGAWPNLMKLARRTATTLAATLLSPKAPLLLT